MEQLHLAGRPISDPEGMLARYANEHWRTLRDYDGIAGTSTTVNEPIVAATRRVASRISCTQGEWFIETSQSAPWRLVPPGARLQMADASTRNGLYDEALRLWNHFRENAPKGVAIAKISKVLYLVRPALFPILDSRMVRLYRDAAGRTAEDLRQADSPFLTRRMYWEAIRRDLVIGAEQFDAIQQRTRGSHPSLASLSDVRVHDILCWQLLH